MTESIHRPVKVEYKGKTYHGSYTVEDQYITVTYRMETKTTQFDRFANNP